MIQSQSYSLDSDYTLPSNLSKVIREIICHMRIYSRAKLSPQSSQTPQYRRSWDCRKTAVLKNSSEGSHIYDLKKPIIWDLKTSGGIRGRWLPRLYHFSRVSTLAVVPRFMPKDSVWHCCSFSELLYHTGGDQPLKGSRAHVTIIWLFSPARLAATHVTQTTLLSTSSLRMLPIFQSLRINLGHCTRGWVEIC